MENAGLITLVADEDFVLMELPESKSALDKEEHRCEGVTAPINAVSPSCRNSIRL